ncbi:hypothetical protein BDZ97DRAFT_1915563 [Flammula alnicola]|nr:hypothetical protein BDZ97DRAFT_1915563 [Flammula alnicola]
MGTTSVGSMIPAVVASAATTSTEGQKDSAYSSRSSSGKRPVLEDDTPKSFPSKKRNQSESSKKSPAAVQLSDYAAEELHCLSEVLGACQFPQFSDAVIQRSLELPVDEDNNEARVRTVLVLPYYEPISKLTEDLDVLMDEFWRLFCYLPVLWANGVEHGDISISNLIYDEEKKQGRLCDFDLSQCSEDKVPSGSWRRGTMLFMARELLDVHGNDTITPVYRHAAESFVWVLFWLLTRYEDGKQLHWRVPPSYQNWSWSMGACLRKKEEIVQNIPNRHPRNAVHEPSWNTLRAVLVVLNSTDHIRALARKALDRKSEVAPAYEAMDLPMPTVDGAKSTLEIADSVRYISGFKDIIPVKYKDLIRLE